jgi:hypothetical protein
MSDFGVRFWTDSMSPMTIDEYEELSQSAAHNRSFTVRRPSNHFDGTLLQGHVRTAVANGVATINRPSWRYRSVVRCSIQFGDGR